MRVDVQDELSDIHERFVNGEFETIREKLADVLDDAVQEYSKEETEQMLEQMDFLPGFTEIAKDVLEDVDEW